MNDVFQLEKGLFIIAKRTDDASAAFDGDVGIAGRYFLPVVEDDFLSMGRPSQRAAKWGDTAWR